MDIAATSTEYVHVPVTATTDDNGNPITLTTQPRLAILTGNSNPADSDWHTGEWVNGNARILIGPQGGTLTLTPGTSYWVWVTWAAGDETPVYRAGRLRAI